jgi:hypothetical protein
MGSKDEHPQQTDAWVDSLNEQNEIFPTAYIVCRSTSQLCIHFMRVEYRTYKIL